MAGIQDLHRQVADWRPIGIPLAPLMHLEERKSRLELVIARQNVDLESPSFLALAREREKWPGRTITASPGPCSSAAPAPITSPSLCC